MGVSKDNKLILIAGPTAVGKSSLSYAIQELLDTIIISSDSRQVYQEMGIGTAKPVKEEIISHHIQLCDHVSIESEYNVGLFEQEAIGFLNEHYQNSNTAILCGGTGLYMHAVLKGLNEFPDVSEQIKNHWQSILDLEGIDILQEELKRRDPQYAQMVDLDNPHRLMRALSVMDVEHKTYSSYLNRPLPERNFSPLVIVLERPREELYERIDKRVLQMFDEGLIKECESLLPKRHLKALQTVGYSECFDYLLGKLSLYETIDKIQTHSRQYAKRQITWFKKYLPGQRFHPDDKGKIIHYVEQQSLL